MFIGKKPTMNYVLAVVTQFNSGTNDVAIKARGRAISRAVDVAEIVRRRFIPGVSYKDIKISTDAIPTEGGGTANVSSIEIYLTKRGGSRLRAVNYESKAREARAGVGVQATIPTGFRRPRFCNNSGDYM